MSTPRNPPLFHFDDKRTWIIVNTEITLRDLFALAFVASGTIALFGDEPVGKSGFAALAYRVSDAMLEERERAR